MRLWIKIERSGEFDKEEISFIRAQGMQTDRHSCISLLMEKEAAYLSS